VLTALQSLTLYAARLAAHAGSMPVIDVDTGCRNCGKVCPDLSDRNCFCTRCSEGWDSRAPFSQSGGTHDRPRLSVYRRNFSLRVYFLQPQLIITPLIYSQPHRIRNKNQHHQQHDTNSDPPRRALHLQAHTVHGRESHLNGQHTAPQREMPTRRHRKTMQCVHNRRVESRA